MYQTWLGYVPISSSVPWALGAANVPILLSKVEQEQGPSGNGNRGAILVGAGLCDGERAYSTKCENGRVSKGITSKQIGSLKLIWMRLF